MGRTRSKKEREENARNERIRIQNIAKAFVLLKFVIGVPQDTPQIQTLREARQKIQELKDKLQNGDNERMEDDITCPKDKLHHH